VKCREEGRIVNVACLIGVGVKSDGAARCWAWTWSLPRTEPTAFLRSLRARGLQGVDLVISDAHPGLKDAIASRAPEILGQGSPNDEREGSRLRGSLPFQLNRLSAGAR
jgi:transposase-like protein